MNAHTKGNQLKLTAEGEEKNSALHLVNSECF